MKRNKILSTLLAGAMLVTSLGALPAAADDTDSTVVPTYTDTVPEPEYDFDFEDGELPSGAAFPGGDAAVTDENGGKAMYLNGGTYMTLPMPTDTDGNPIEHFTVSFDVKNSTTGNYFTFAASDGERRATGSNYVGIKAADSVLISASNAAAAEVKTTVAAGTVQGTWTHFDVVVSAGITQVYVNKDLKGTLNGYTMAEINPTVLTFGLSPWSADNYANAYYDNIKVYRAALSPAAILGDDAPEKRPEADSEHLLFGINFNDKTAEAYKGKAELSGSLTYDYGRDYSYAAALDGASYISASKDDGTSLLTGLDGFTVSYRAKTAGSTSWWMYTAPDTTVPTYGYEKYIGMLDSGTSMKSERYSNTTGVRSDALTYDYTDGGWHDVDIVTGKDSSTLYVDGTAVDTITSTVDVSELLGESSIFYIGKALWGTSGELAVGTIDDYEVYDFAPEPDFGDVSLKQITENITLPTASEDTDGYSLSWTSSDATLLEADGTVHRPAKGKHKVTLTATIKYGVHELTKTYDAIVCGETYNDFSLNITDEKGVDIQQNMYGLFFEDINFAADGGLYAEMVENRSFETETYSSKGNYENPGCHWSAVDGTMSYESTGEPLDENNPHYLTFTGKSFKSTSYDGMYIERGKTYNISLYARVGGYDGGITVRTDKYGITGFSVTMTEDNIAESDFSDNGWAKYTASVTAENTVRYSDFIIELDESAAVDFDMISVMPDDAVCGLFRKDLAEKLKALNPGFLRFPGGCIIEGKDLDNAYRWKDSVGAIEQRKQNWNRWAVYAGYENYNQTYGLGYYEYFILCEYLSCDPVPVQNVGMACEYQDGANGRANVPVYESDGVTYTEEFYEYIRDTLDLIEFANSTDFENSEWARLRRDMGHEEPFKLEMIGIGNEQWEITGGKDGSNSWHERYEAFEKEIHKYYPDMKLIGTSGPEKDGSKFTTAWSWIYENQAENSSFVHAVDEHYYVSTDWFYENDDRYDDYDRSAKVFAGEYAAWTNLTGEAAMRNNLDSALAEAAFMTGLERNADVVYMASYAPLFARIGYVQWNPDMIWFDDTSSYGTPDYWVQHMYMNNNGDYTLKSEVTDNLEKVYQTVSYDTETGDIIIKLANPTENEQITDITVADTFDLSGAATVETLSGTSLADVNSISNPDNVSPVTETITGVASAYRHTVPALSFQVIRLKTASGSSATTAPATTAPATTAPATTAPATTAPATTAPATTAPATTAPATTAPATTAPATTAPATTAPATTAPATTAPATTAPAENPTVTDNGTSLTFGVTVENPQASCYVYAAEYSSAGELVKVNLTPLELDTDVTSITIDKAETSVRVKLFVWDSDMKPIMKPFVYETTID